MRMQSPLGGFFFLFLGATAAWAQQQPTVKATTLLKTTTTTTTITGQKLEYPGKNPEVTATVVEIRQVSMSDGTSIQIFAMSM